MPGGPQHVRAQELAVVVSPLDGGVQAALGSQADGPFCGEIVLSLYGAQPLHRIHRLFKAIAGNPLVVQALVSEVRVRHFSEKGNCHCARFLRRSSLSASREITSHSSLPMTTKRS